MQIQRKIVFVFLQCRFTQKLPIGLQPSSGKSRSFKNIHVEKRSCAISYIAPEICWLVVVWNSKVSHLRFFWIFFVKNYCGLQPRNAILKTANWKFCARAHMSWLSLLYSMHELFRPSTPNFLTCSLIFQKCLLWSYYYAFFLNSCWLGWGLLALFRVPENEVCNWRLIPFDTFHTLHVWFFVFCTSNFFYLLVFKVVFSKTNSEISVIQFSFEKPLHGDSEQKRTNRVTRFNFLHEIL